VKTKSKMAKEGKHAYKGHQFWEGFRRENDKYATQRKLAEELGLNTKGKDAILYGRGGYLEKKKNPELGKKKNSGKVKGEKHKLGKGLWGNNNPRLKGRFVRA